MIPTDALPRAAGASSTFAGSRPVRTTLAIARRELLSLFVSPVAYIVLFAFLLLNGSTFQFYLRALDGEMPAVIASQFGGIPFWFLSLAIPPLVTMRSIAEERRSGTFELLVSTGAGDLAIIGGKFLAGWCFIAILWLAILPLLALVESVGKVDWGAVISLYVGLGLSSALFTAVGILASSLTQNQLVAAVLGLSGNLAIFFLNWLRVLFPPGAIEIRYFEYLSPVYHFGTDFTQGVIDLRVVVLYLGVAAWSLFLAVKVLERRRWS